MQPAPSNIQAATSAAHAPTILAAAQSAAVLAATQSAAVLAATLAAAGAAVVQVCTRVKAMAGLVGMSV